MSAVATNYPHIVKDPGTLGGEPRVEGHRIRVRDIVAMRDVHGHTPEQILQLDYPHLSLAQIYAALAYYEDHSEEISEYERQEVEIIERFRVENPESVRNLRAVE